MMAEASAKASLWDVKRCYLNEYRSLLDLEGEELEKLVATVCSDFCRLERIAPNNWRVAMVPLQ